MTALTELQPTTKGRVIDLLRDAKVNVSDWKNFAGGRAKEAANPKYCYNWSFVEPQKLVAVCLWFGDLLQNGSLIYHDKNFRLRGSSVENAPGATVWARRARQSDEDIQLAYREKLPVRVIVLEGIRRRSDDFAATASRVTARRLDERAWAVAEYDFATGECLLIRGRKPVQPILQQADEEMSSFEGWKRLAFVRHRSRERHLRLAKLKAARRANNGRLLCEVPNCGFDFLKRYGDLGDGYAQVHHKRPLSEMPDEGAETTLSDLAVVCANCHAMIHRGGECRTLEGLIADPQT